MKAIIYIIERDFKRFFRYRWWLVGLISMNLADLFIMALVYTKMVRSEILASYFRFFSPGITITALFAAAFMIGREVNWEVRRDYASYLLSLPIKRWELAFGRVLSGGLRGMVYMAPLLLTTFAFLGSPTIFQLFIILSALFLIAIGTSSLSISIAASITSFEKFVTARGVVYYLLFFCSTVFYPINLMEQLKEQGVLPPFMVDLARNNPLSCGADLIRSFLLNSPEFTPYLIINLLAYAFIFVVLGALTYVKMLQRTR